MLKAKMIVLEKPSLLHPMYNRKKEPVQKIFDAAQELSVEEQAELISMLLNLKPASSLFMETGMARLSTQTVSQINMSSKEEFAQILESIATKMKEDSSDPLSDN